MREHGHDPVQDPPGSRHLSDRLSQRSLYGQSYRLKDELTIEDLVWRAQHVIDPEVHVIRDQLHRNGIELLGGAARFVDEHTLSVTATDGVERIVRGDHIVIATGTTPTRPAGIDFDGATILDSDGILDLKHIPRSFVIVGAGVIGVEYASMFAALGTKVTIVERQSRLLEFCDSHIVEALQYQLRELGVVFRFGESVATVDRVADGTITSLESGKRIAADGVLYSAGRRGATDGLGLETIGIEPDARGRIAVGPDYPTLAESYKVAALDAMNKMNALARATG